ncbi:hypothetical protein PLCT1_00237 [Planctomycetaceae bacterium]|nr:hypothetical protein PLCT1_00237 [Planctomycetaceae bacterium]
MDPKEKSISLDEFLFRKLQPIRILKGYLVGELEMTEGEEVHMSRQDFDNIVSTLDIFLEEYDRVSAFRGRKAIGQTEKKTSFLDASKPQSIKQIA